MENNELKFKWENPGAVQHGNFINYYQFHPPENRISLLPTNIWNLEASDEDFLVLDVGCNAGDLTASLHEFFKTKINKANCSILGVDIDPVLIQRATEKNSCPNIYFQHLDFMNEDKRQEILNTFLKQKTKDIFDAVFCFSTTMWIHLNNGDEGLINFLQKLTKICKMLIIEPQPWKCYKAALKRVKGCEDTFPNFKELKIRNDVENTIEDCILKCGMKKIHESNRTQWGRKLLFFIN